MARSGLRMMPTFPSPPLKFRTVSFPQYGLKAGISGGTFLESFRVKPAPGIPHPDPSLSLPFACAPHGEKPGSEPRPNRGTTCRHMRGKRPSAPGVLGSGASCVVSLHHRLYDPICQSHRHAAISRHSPYTRRLRCAGAPRRPVGPSRLSLLFLPCVPSTLPRRSAAPSHCAHAAIPGFLEIRSSRHPRYRLCQQ
jgi:hypothetical protein